MNAAQTVDLPAGRLAHFSVHYGKVIPIDSGGAGGDGAGRALSTVMDVVGDAVLRGYMRRYHLQKVELGGDLEEGTFVTGVGMERARLADYVPNADGALGSPANPRSEFAERWRLQHPNLVAGPVRAGPEPGSVNFQVGSDLLRGSLLESEQLLEPVSVHGGQCWRSSRRGATASRARSQPDLPNSRQWQRRDPVREREFTATGIDNPKSTRRGRRARSGSAPGQNPSQLPPTYAGCTASSWPSSRPRRKCRTPRSRR